MHPDSELPSGRVALLFTDVQGSTALLHELGDAFGDVLDEHDRILRGVWEEFGGVEVDNEGDAFFVAFADHARAIDAVTAAQQRLGAGAWPDGVQLKVRMALHSGEPAIRGRKYWGVDVHYAARLGSAAHGGQVLLSAAMRAAAPHAPVELVGAHGLKDFPAPRQLFHLVTGGSTARDFPPPRTLTAVRSNLPTIDTPIIGREEVLADLRRRLTGPDHLVTLVAPGGMGKTRTAIAIGNELTPDFPDGVAFVAMASLAKADEVVPAIADALQEDLRGADPEEALIALLRGRKFLVILDNAEHVPDLPELVARLVSASPEHRWLVTSQAPLGIRAEAQVRLEALEMPVDGDTDADIEYVPSVALFLDRARARQPSFAVADADRHLLTNLCLGLEGMPLALELAAVRAPTLGLARLVQALVTDPESALGRGPADLPDRQRGLRAALDWTVSLLTGLEREVYATGGAFAEAWSLDDLEFMLAGKADVSEAWDALARLLDLSLVVQRGDGRFTMPERVRRHSTQLLISVDDDHLIRRRHAELVLRTVYQRCQVERQYRFRLAMAGVEDHLPEIQHALVWASTNDTDTYRMLLGSTGWALGWFDKHRPWLPDLVSFARAQDPGDLAQGRIWAFAATRMAGVEDAEERRSWTAAALNRFDELGDHAWACEMYITQFEMESSEDQVDPEILRVGAGYAASHNLPGYARAMDDMTAVGLLLAGEYAEAERRIRQWIDEPEASNWCRAGAATFLGDCAFGQEHYLEAVGWYAEDLRGVPRSELGNSLMQAYAIAASSAGLGQDLLAAELVSAVDRLTSELQVDMREIVGATGLDKPLNDALLRLSPSELEVARARGQALDYDAVLERALEIAAEVTTGTPA